MFEGAILSDGGLYPGGQLDMTQSGREHLDWLYHVGVALGRLGVIVCPGYPKLKYPSRVYPDGSTRKAVYRLTTRTSEFLKLQRGRWYPDDVKEVPEDLLLTPATLANWFVGDGGSDRDKRQPITVYVRLATHSFNEHSVRILGRQLQELRIRTGKPTRYNNVASGSGLRMRISQGSVDHFMSLVGPYIQENLPSYLDKIKYKEVQR